MSNQHRSPAQTGLLILCWSDRKQCVEKSRALQLFLQLPMLQKGGEHWSWVLGSAQGPPQTNDTELHGQWQIHAWLGRGSSRSSVSVAQPGHQQEQWWAAAARWRQTLTSAAPTGQNHFLQSPHFSTDSVSKRPLCADREPQARNYLKLM